MNDILEQLQINHTFWYEFGLFILFFFILSQIYLKPFQKLIEKRSHKLKDDVTSATELLKTVEGMLTAYEKEIAAARTESRLNYEKVVAEVRAKEDSSIAVFKDELKKDYLKVTQQLTEEKNKIQTELSAHVNELAESVATKTLAGN
jgi:F0F1-type ATP synthase membrane subunit b/b'